MDSDNTLTFNLYDLNKSVINQLPTLTEIEIKEKLKIIEDYQEAVGNTYHMLLCKEFNHYTIFGFSIKPSFNSLAEAVYTILIELGEVYSIEFDNKNESVEIWIKPTGEELPLAFYLFPYDKGMVYYG